MEIKKLLGHRVYLEYPQEPETNIILDEATKHALDEDRMKKWGRLVVYAVGDSIEGLEEGDEVMIDPSCAQKVLKIPLTPDKDVLLVSYFDIAHIW